MIRKLVLLFEGRTGSSMFGGMLNQHPEIGFLGEEVADLLDDGWEAQERWIDRLFSEPPAMSDPRLTPPDDLRVVGFKVKLREVASTSGLAESLVEHRARIVHMTRRNLVKQAVSSIRATDLYEATGHFNLDPGQEDLVPGPYEIPVERFHRILTWLESHVEALERFVSRLPLPVLRLAYEDLVGDTDGTMRRVWDWLDVPCTDVYSRSIKVTSDDLSDVVSNYDEIVDHYRGTRFAAFFRGTSPRGARIPGGAMATEREARKRRVLTDEGTLLDYERLLDLAQERGGEYRSADPYPHIVVDDFLPESSLRRILDAFPSGDPRDSEVRWRAIDADTEDGKPAQRGKLDFSTREGADLLSNEYFVEPVIRQLFWEMNSSTFLRFLERMTGIRHLIPDPHMQGGGIHHVHRGGMLRVHADFSRHPVNELDRRVNVLLYMNPDWKEEYGGHLELWSRDMERCVRKVLPVANRCVIFSTRNDSYHGHPHPLNCPEGRTRQSVAMYYYTNGRPEEERSEPHATLWQETPDE